MKLIILLLAFGMIWHANPVSAQTTNVGIGTTNPAEKLDVNGNINLNGTIKVNGQDGQAGQVLMRAIELGVHIRIQEFQGVYIYISIGYTNI